MPALCIDEYFLRSDAVGRMFRDLRWGKRGLSRSRGVAVGVDEAFLRRKVHRLE